MTALVAQLKTITTANGYTTNLGANVAEWRGYPAETSEMPIAIVRDGEDKLESEHAVHQHELEVAIEIITSGANAVSDVRKMLADVYRAIGVDTSVGGYVNEIEYTGDTLSLVHEEQKIISGLVSLLLRFKTGPFDPDKIYNV
jgi:hypothetical protein